MIGELVPTKRGRPKGKKDILPSIKPQDLIRRYQQGEYGTEIAKSLGVSHQALYAYLLKHCEQDWQNSQVARALAEYETSKLRVEELGKQAAKIKDNVTADRVRIALACAREQQRSAQWELEKLCRRLFGQDQPPNAGAGLTINIGIARTENTPDIVTISSQSDDK